MWDSVNINWFGDKLPHINMTPSWSTRPGLSSFWILVQSPSKVYEAFACVLRCGGQGRKLSFVTTVLRTAVVNPVDLKLPKWLSFFSNSLHFWRQLVDCWCRWSRKKDSCWPPIHLTSWCVLLDALQNMSWDEADDIVYWWVVGRDGYGALGVSEIWYARSFFPSWPAIFLGKWTRNLLHRWKTANNAEVWCTLRFILSRLCLGIFPSLLSVFYRPDACLDLRHLRWFVVDEADRLLTQRPGREATMGSSVVGMLNRWRASPIPWEPTFAFIF